MFRLHKLLDQLSYNNSDKIICNHNVVSQQQQPLLSQKYPELTSKLKNILGSRYSEDNKILYKHGREVIGYARSSPPNAVIFPINTEEVVKIVKLCNNNNPPISLTPYAAGSSLEGHIINKDGGITISFAKMNKILKVYPTDMQCVVEPGVNWVKLNKYLKQYNLFIGVDPAPAACIGGMVGTCCSGPSALKYGTMRNQLINLEIVLPNGNIVTTGQRAIKSVAGYDLNGLFCGSEGTLGIITKITLQLRVIPKYVEVGQALFDTINDIGNCVKEINKSGVMLGAFEYMDPNMINDLIKFDPKINLIKNKYIIMFKFVGPTKDHINGDIKLIKSIVKQYTKYPFRWSSNNKERERLWHARKMAFWASKFAYPGKECFVTDVAIPQSKFGEHLILCSKKLSQSNIGYSIVGHIGDGNWHSVLFFDPKNKKEINEAKRLNQFIVHSALQMEGTCTAEHGVGKGKRKYLTRELGQNTVDLMKTIKYSIDPNNILAPGNIV